MTGYSAHSTHTFSNTELLHNTRFNLSAKKSISSNHRAQRKQIARKQINYANLAKKTMLLSREIMSSVCAGCFIYSAGNKHFFFNPLEDKCACFISLLNIVRLFLYFLKLPKYCLCALQRSINIVSEKSLLKAFFLYEQKIEKQRLNF